MRSAGGWLLHCLPRSRVSAGQTLLSRRPEPLPQECGHTLEEELTFVRFENDLALVVQRRPMVVGEEEGFGLETLFAELLDQELGVRPEGIGVPDRDER